jgi:hypothetical protein
LCHRPVSLAALRLCYPCNAFVYEALAHVLRCSRRRQECATVAYLICAKYYRDFERKRKLRLGPAIGPTTS